MRESLRNHREVAEVWANRKQFRGSCGNMFFLEKTIYSYGYHFPIAFWLTNDTVLFNSRTYSPSTSHHHQAYVRRSIPKGTKVLMMNLQPDFYRYHDKLIYPTLGDALRLIEESKRPKIRKTTRERRIKAAQDICRTILEYCKITGASAPKEVNDILGLTP